MSMSCFVNNDDCVVENEDDDDEYALNDDDDDDDDDSNADNDDALFDNKDDGDNCNTTNDAESKERDVDNDDDDLVDDEYEYDDEDDGDDGDDYEYNDEYNNDDEETKLLFKPNPLYDATDTDTTIIAAKRRKNSSSRPTTTTAAIPTTGDRVTAACATATGAHIVLVPANHLQQEMDQRIEEVHEALGVPREAASPLLRIHGWRIQSLFQQYFDDTADAADGSTTMTTAATVLLKQAGVYHRCNGDGHRHHDPQERRGRECAICMEEIVITMTDGRSSSSSSLRMKCGHEFCLDCWNEYLINAIEYEGMTCITATCPDASCREVITEKEVRFVVDAISTSTSTSSSLQSLTAALTLLTKFERYQLRSFVDSNALARWCPGKGCDRVAYLRNTHPGFCFSLQKNTSPAKLQFVPSCTSVFCQQNHPCNSGFCLPCGHPENHEPASCHHVQQWTMKNSSNNMADTLNYISIHTKACPKCKTRIAKNGGCMFMHCPKCAHGFCWMCGGTHHVYSCNAFPENQDDATTTTTTPMDDAQRKRNELERYLHYFQRYQGHDVGQKYATKQVLKFHEMETNDNYGGIGENSVRSLGPKTTKMTKSTRSASALPSSLALSSALSVPVAAGAPSSVIIGSIATLPPKELFDVRMKFKHANEQLLICRRVLKYTYVFAYYKFMETTTIAAQNCFENHQGILEGLTEQLSKICETDLQTETIDVQDMTNKTRSIQTFIRNVLEFVDDGLQL